MSELRPRFMLCGHMHHPYSSVVVHDNGGNNKAGCGAGAAINSTSIGACSAGGGENHAGTAAVSTIANTTIVRSLAKVPSVGSLAVFEVFVISDCCGGRARIREVT